jgi:ABC-type bacteriocin/lantibiotic exporter with double-glycine peptidase domain
MLLGFYLNYLKEWSQSEYQMKREEDLSLLEKIIPRTHRDMRVLVAVPLTAGLVTMISAVKNEHSSRLKKKCSTFTKKVIKKLIFRKVMTASRKCLQVSDSSLLNKLFLFETKAVASYYESVPNFFIFPYNLFITISAMMSVLSWSTSITLPVFLIACVSLIKIVKVISVNLQKKAFYTSKRSSAVFSLLKYFQQVKTSSLEELTQSQIMKLRDKEMKAIDQIDGNRSFSTFVFTLAPMVSFILILYIEIKLRHQRLDVASTFTLLSLISGLSGPLKQFFLIMDKHSEFKESEQALNEFLFSLPDKPTGAYKDKNLFPGYIVFEKCYIEKYSKRSLKKLI